MPRIEPSEIKARSSLILALDLPIQEAKKIVLDIGSSLNTFKLGMETFTDKNAFGFVDWLVSRGAKVFADLKLYDIPRTVGAATRNLANTGISFITVYGNHDMLNAALNNCGYDLKVISVACLSSAYNDPLDVNLRVQVANDLGCYGAVVSGQDCVRSSRKNSKANFKIFTPGVREDAVNTHDHKNYMSTACAIKNGSDYIIIGRPILQANSPKNYIDFIVHRIMEE